MADVPGAILTTTIRAYVLGACFMVIWARRMGAGSAGVVPELRTERALWLVWVPILAAWVILPGLATPVWFVLPGLDALRRHPLVAVPHLARTHPALSTLRWAASLGAAACLCLTIACWARMGKNWRLSVVVSQKTDLVTGGLYAWIRHPIYAFNILLMVCSVVVVPTPPMMVVGVIHVILIVLKTSVEERSLLAAHGESYARYSQRTGRFLPRLVPSRPSPGPSGRPDGPGEGAPPPPPRSRCDGEGASQRGFGG